MTARAFALTLGLSLLLARTASATTSSCQNADDGAPCGGCAVGTCLAHVCIATTNLPDNTPCASEDRCTINDSCQGGVCVSGPSRVCPSISACQIGVCNIHFGCIIKDVCPPDLSTTDQAGIDLAGADFSGQDMSVDTPDLTGADFAGADFSGQDFAGADFSGQDFAGADFSGQDLTGTAGDRIMYDFYGVDLTGIDPCTLPIGAEFFSCDGGPYGLNDGSLDGNAGLHVRGSRVGDCAFGGGAARESLGVALLLLALLGCAWRRSSRSVPKAN